MSSHGSTSFAVLVSVLAVLAGSCTKKPEPVEVVISLDQAAQGVRTATILVDYSAAPGAPLSTDGHPACASLLPDVQADFSDDGAGALTIRTTSESGFSTPVDLAVCRMVGSDASVTAEAISAGLEISMQGGVTVSGQRLEERRVAQARPRREAGAQGAAPPPKPSHEEAEEPLAADEEAVPGQPRAEATAPGATPQPQAGVMTPPPVAQPGTQAAARPQSLIPSRPAPGSSSAPETELPGSKQSSRTPEDPFGTGNREPQSNDESDEDTRAVSYAVSIGITTPSGVLGALQFDIRHVGASGGWLGAGSGAVCTPDVPVALATFNDRGDRWLSAAMVDLSGITPPGPVVTCTFKSREQVSAGSFSVQVIDAAGVDADDAKPDPFPAMAVTNVSALN
jgi:hypothetical protein